MSLRPCFALCLLFVALPLIAADKPAKKPTKPAAKPKVVKPKVVEPSLADLPAVPWPPQLPGFKENVITLSSPEFLTIPETVVAEMAKDPNVKFDVAKKAPTVDIAFHDELGTDASKRRLWSSWGDICAASDGSAYCAIGDHGNDVGGDARCFIYRWDPQTKKLTQVVDMNKLVPPKPGRPSWSKVHAKIDEGKDGKIYFSCTLNDGNRAKLPSHGWDDEVTGGQIYQYDPATGKSRLHVSLPPKRCTATSFYDKAHDIWWCNLEAGEGQALWGIELATKKEFFKTPDGTVGFNRACAPLKDGSFLFNGPDRLMKFNFASHEIEPTKTSFGKSPGMRCATRETSDGLIFGVTHAETNLFSYSIKKDELKLLGKVLLGGGYTTVMELSPDEKYLYYLPGAHGKASSWGTPLVRYERATGKQTVLAFLAPYCEKTTGYIPGGTYGMKLSADGKTIFVNFNGHCLDAHKPPSMKKMTPGFGLTSFAAIHLADE